MYRFLHLTTGGGGGGGIIGQMSGSFSLWELPCMLCVHLALWTGKVLCGSFFAPYISFHSVFQCCKITSMEEDGMVWLSCFLGESGSTARWTSRQLVGGKWQKDPSDNCIRAITIPPKGTFSYFREGPTSSELISQLQVHGGCEYRLVSRVHAWLYQTHSHTFTHTYRHPITVDYNI